MRSSFLVVLTAYAVTASCTPPATPSDGCLPSLQDVCAHSADLAWLEAPPQGWPEGTTKEGTRQQCEARFADYRDEGEAARWDCHAWCRMDAKTYAQPQRCDPACAIPVLGMSCDDAFVASEVAEALGVEVKQTDGAFRHVTQDHPSCSGMLAVHGPTRATFSYGLHLKDTRHAAGRAAEHSLENTCRVAMARGRVHIAVELSGPSCDLEGLKRAVTKAFTHIDGQRGVIVTPAPP